ncbi:aminoacyl-histidine dipeptidase [Sporanaerobium hydrogeniformans]|uniref:Aminoacyl-histidine dipeptidase n=1 Tax=Sporanaerobium hydrogeniformans TaxID=3072179 RepID=A0AC61DF45_9FIRM|nr:aminoacyl-histidine dipeptidase [Sporanaerobium hydrogeniformans]PHV71458.1 aminoacyl-histidine dipeptidase [Sporanaerobium hydrogeniformans]
MTQQLKGLEPQNIFHYFEEISCIPRGSGKEKAISDYMVQFATDLGFWVKQDEAYNVYIKKPATPGYEKAPTVILQGHLDMVCEKNKETVHDFEKEGLKLYIEGDYIRARGTTLGADNGIAIAYQMAVLADTEHPHPALEILMTTDEERGMTGVANMHPEYLEGKLLINLDTDLEGEFLVSCAGGLKAYIDLPLQTEKTLLEEGLRITIKGLLGGHSGADIHFERANAHLLMGRLLYNLREEVPFQVQELIGGSKDNVITRECEVVLAISKEQKERVKRLVLGIQETIQKEFAAQDAGICFYCEETTLKDEVFTKVLTDQIIDALVLIPNGIMGFDQNMKGLVQTSLNLGILQVGDDKVRLGSAVRSSVPSKKLEIVAKLETLSRFLGAELTVQGDYPAWEYREESTLRDLALKVYKKLYDQEPHVTSIHAGLECGFIAEKISDLDMISFGPNVKDIHSPEERVSISSMARVYDYLLHLLASIQ